VRSGKEQEKCTALPAAEGKGWYEPEVLTNYLIESARKTLDEGEVILRYPAALSQESFEDFEEWLQLVIRKAKRSIKTDSADRES
jgi:hypothetical protein